jgi:glyoxylase-like metal-dependent hydrolase (beta-lactamase superfamily II)
MPLTSGNELLTNQQWQTVPGDDHARVFPYIRKVDTNSSNSYIISTRGQIILIDPGGYKEQMDVIAAEIESAAVADPRPVFVYLTHTHIDHFLAIQSHPFFSGTHKVVLAAHVEGAASLEAADTEGTQADLFGQTFTPIQVPMKFFSPVHEPGSDFFEICPLEGPCVRVQDSDIRVDEHLILARQVVVVGPQDRVEIYHMPGHSPDSICIRIGAILFIGDLLFAVNPGIAGIKGWNQEHLLSSLHKIQWLLDNEDIRVCCSGHGRLISSESAKNIFSRMIKEIYNLTEIEEVTPEWAKATAEYAEDLMDRVAGCFTIMAGRCYRAAYILNELEESGEAENISTLLNSGTIDEVLSDFHQFHEDYRAGNQRDVHLALKAGQITARLENIYKMEPLDLVIDPYLVRRVARLLSDYMTTFRGFRQIPRREPFELNSTLGPFLNALTQCPCSNEDLIMLADDEKAYTKALARRLVYVPVFEEFPITFDPAEWPVPVRADADRITDLVASIIEELVGADSQDITVRSDSQAGRAIITVSGIVKGSIGNFPEGKARFLGRECELAGGSLTWNRNGPECSFIIAISHSDME